MGVLPVCMSMHCVYTVHVEARRESQDSLGVQLHVGGRTRIHIHSKSSQGLWSFKTDWKARKMVQLEARLLNLLGAQDCTKMSRVVPICNPSS